MNTLTPPSDYHSLKEEATAISYSKSHLYSLIHRQLYDLAVDHLSSHPNDARIWIIHHDDDNDDEYHHHYNKKKRSLPLHLACQAQYPPPLLLIEKLLHCYPGACSQFNSSNSLPIHLACTSVSFVHGPHLAQGVILRLITVYSRGLMVVDRRGRRAVDLLEENVGLSSSSIGVGDRWGGSLLRLIKSKMRDYCDDDENENELRDDVDDYAQPVLFGVEERDDNDDAVSFPDSRREFLQREQRIESKYAATRIDERVGSFITNEGRDENRQSSNNSHEFPDDITPRHENRRGRPRRRNQENACDSYDTGSRNYTTIRDRSVDGSRGGGSNRRRRTCIPNKYSRTERIDRNADADKSVKTPRVSNKGYRIKRGNHQRTPNQSFANSLEYSYSSSSEVQTPNDDYSASDEYCYNHAPMVTPADGNFLSASSSTEPNDVNNITTLSTANKDPFHHLEQELRTMKCAHQSMSTLLSTKANNESYLQSRLSKLEEAHEELQHKFSLQSSINAQLEQQTSEMKRLLHDKDHELKIMRTKEGAISSELACRLRKDEEMQCNLKEMTERFKDEERKRSLMEEELHREKIATTQLRKAHEQATRSNSELTQQLDAAAVEKQSMQHENAVLRQEIVNKDKQLAEAKTKETSLFDQLMSKLALSESAETRFKEMDNQLKEEQERRRELEQELQALQCDVRKKADTEQKMQTLLREEHAKNIALDGELSKMREKVLAAKEGLAYLQRGKATLHTAPHTDGKMASKPVGAHRVQSNEIGALSSSQSIELLSPMIQDALSIQQDTIHRAQQLFNKANSTQRYIEHISDISTPDFPFQTTLQLLERILTTHIKTIEGLDDAIDFEESCHLELSSLLDIPPHQFDLEFDAPTTNIAPQIPNSIQLKQYTKLKAATKSHMKKIENLHKMSLELQPVQPGKHIDKKHCRVAHEMASIFQQAMDALLEDSKQLSVMMEF